MDAAAETSDDLLALLMDGAEAGAAPAPAGEEGDPLEDLLGFAVELVTNPPPEIAAARAAAVPTPAPAPTAASLSAASVASAASFCA